MISYIKGELTEILEDGVVVEASGVGYHIMVPASLFRELPKTGSPVRLFTHFQVKEDSMSLYGFFCRDDVRMFRMLIGVSGIGPKGGLGILSQLSADDLRFAVLSGDVKAISATPGIGKKTAEKLIIELKDKLDLDDMLHPAEEGIPAAAADPGATSVQSEAVQALVALGYGSTESLKAVKKVKLEDATVEEVLKAALKNF